MKVLTALLLTLSLLGGGLGIFMASKNQKTTITPASVTIDLKNHVLQIPQANLKAVDCKQVQNGVQINGGVCYLSSLPPEKLLEEVQKAIEPIAVTHGWSEDYMVWHAFYAYKGAPKMTFGVNVGDPHNSATFQAAVNQGMRSFVAFVVDSGTEK